MWREEPRGIAQGTSSWPVVAPVRRPRGLRWVAVAGAIGLVALVAVAAGWLLRGRAPGTARVPIRLAVLPFDNLSRDPEQEHFAGRLRRLVRLPPGTPDPYL